jgi:hypothetical protein
MTRTPLLSRIRREFREHPGIALTLPQAQVLWSLDRERCTQAFTALKAEGFLTQVDDVFLWGDAPVPRFRRRPSVRIAHR